MNEDSDGVEILGSVEFSGCLDAWTECLCLKRLPDGGIELSSRRFVLLRYEGEWFGKPVVWPEGYDADVDDADQDVLPISVGGTLVRGRDGCGIVGNELYRLRLIDSGFWGFRAGIEAVRFGCHDSATGRGHGDDRRASERR